LVLDGGNVVRVASGSNTATAGDFIASSDQRLKENILPLESALDRTLQMRGVTFDWTKQEYSTLGQVGVIAQEVQKSLPEAVYLGENGYLSVSYGKIVPLLIEAIRELKEEVDRRPK
jgi:tRNA splicing endonuclease